MALMQEGPTAVSVDLHAEVRIAAPVDVVWRSLVEDVGAWWPHSFSEEPKITMEPWVGGRFMEEWDGGGGVPAGQRCVELLQMVAPGLELDVHRDPGVCLLEVGVHCVDDRLPVGGLCVGLKPNRDAARGPR